LGEGELGYFAYFTRFNGKCISLLDMRKYLVKYAYGGGGPKLQYQYYFVQHSSVCVCVRYACQNMHVTVDLPYGNKIAVEAYSRMKPFDMFSKDI